MVVEDIDVRQHYRVALAEAGWRVVEDDGQQVRAEPDGMAFEVAACARDVVVWAGRDDAENSPQCEDPKPVGPEA